MLFLNLRFLFPFLGFSSRYFWYTLVLNLPQDHGYLSVALLIDSLIYFLCFQQRREGSGEVQKADMSSAE